MSRINRDVVVAVVLLAVCGAFIGDSFAIRQPDYGTLPPTTWPRAILVAFGFLCVIYLIQSLRQAPARLEETERGLAAWFARYRNPLWCYALFLGFLVAMPVLGILIGGVLFVFSLLTALGGATPRLLVTHLLIAVISVGAMWAIFTYALGVILPQGMIFTTL